MPANDLELIKQSGVWVEIGNPGCIGKLIEMVRADERNKFLAVGEVKDGSFGGFVWNENVTSNEAPDGAVLYVRSSE